MVTRLFIFIVLFSFQSGYGDTNVPFGVWNIGVDKIKKNTNGEFEIQYSWGGKQATLKDNDGIATLATTQILLASQKQVSSGILGIQQEALQKIKKALDEASATLDSPMEEQTLFGTNLSMNEAYQVVQDLLGRYYAKKRWTLEDIEERGKVIRRLVGAGGPYQIKLLDGTATRTFEQSLKDSQDHPGNSFLSGWIVNGHFSPVDAEGGSKSHVYLSGDLNRLTRSYEGVNGSRAENSDQSTRRHPRKKMGHH